MDSDAHRAVIALILHQQGRYGRYSVVERRRDSWIIESYGVPFRLSDDGLQWWASYSLDDSMGNNAKLRRAVEEIIGIELPDQRDPNFTTILGPLGVAAIRAELSAKHTLP